jgi:predicted nucleic acid-binding protein
VTLVLDTGAFLAVERGDRRVMALLKRELLASRAPRSTGGVVGQVWRGGARQAQIARLLQAAEIVPIDLELGRVAGELLGLTRGRDVVDASVVLLAVDGDQILTSDPDDLRAPAAFAGIHVELVRV